MKKNITLLFIYLALVCYSVLSTGQDSLKTKPKNIIYANVGTLAFIAAASVNYERQLFSKDNKDYYYMRVCAGKFATWGGDGPFGTLSLQGVFGSKKSHFEFGIGVGALYNDYEYEEGVSSANYQNIPEPTKWDYTTLTPAGSVGYRYQRPNGGFVFRTGVGYPDGVYLSFGAAF